MAELSATINSFVLALAGCVSLALAAYRLRWGDDYGHYADDLDRSDLPLASMGSFRVNRFDRSRSKGKTDDAGAC